MLYDEGIDFYFERKINFCPSEKDAINKIKTQRDEKYTINIRNIMKLLGRCPWKSNPVGLEIQ